MPAQIGRKQQVVILVPISSIFASRTGGIILHPAQIRGGEYGAWGSVPIPGGGNPTQLKSEGEYMGLGGSVPIPGGGNPTVSTWALWSPAAASRAAASAARFPWAQASSPFWCPGTCTMDTARGKWTAARSLRISGKFLISLPSAIRSPRSLHMGP